MLWAILPLAAWANKMLFRVAVVAYSAFFSFTVLVALITTRHARLRPRPLYH